MQTDVCVFEAKLALMRAALGACIARDEHDDVALVIWRARADYAREHLRSACGYSPQLQLQVAA